MWDNMYRLIIDSTAASLYVAVFLQRQASQASDNDLCDGTVQVEPEEPPVEKKINWFSR